jgi:hypothetical protein
MCIENLGIVYQTIFGSKNTVTKPVNEEKKRALHV